MILLFLFQILNFRKFWRTFVFHKYHNVWSLLFIFIWLVGWLLAGWLAWLALVSLHSPSCPETHSLDQVGLKHRSTYLCLTLKVFKILRLLFLYQWYFVLLLNFFNCVCVYMCICTCTPRHVCGT